MMGPVGGSNEHGAILQNEQSETRKQKVSRPMCDHFLQRGSIADMVNFLCSNDESLV